MKNIHISILYFTVLVLFIFPAASNAQSSDEELQDQSLGGQFQEMLDKSETYTDYKVIKRTSLREYAKAVQDTLTMNRTEISTLKNTIEDQSAQISSLTNRITELESQLETSEELRESLSFLGFNLNKATYHVIVWLIIGILAAFGIFAYSSFIRSNHVTAKTIKEYKALEVEYEEHKKKSHEKQIKMGRELQTERNKVEDLKVKLKAKTQGKS